MQLRHYRFVLLAIACMVLGEHDRLELSAQDPKKVGPKKEATRPEGGHVDDRWPAYKHDAARSGRTTATLATDLQVLWKRDNPAPRPAWAEPGRALNTLDFDYAYQPVAADGLVLYGSSADDSIHALQATTGERVWTFTTGGPVRFAPHLAGEHCYFASDDGYVYCVTTKTGQEVWRYRAALDDRRLLANGRLTSRWPCRSGVLVQDGVVYASAGMWPSEGVYLHALDARTGQPLWCNDTSCYDYVEYPHAPSTAFGGPAPQGYLLQGNGVLVVLTGRCAPAGYDTKTGKLHYFWANSPNRGGTWATLTHDTIFVSAVAWQPDQPVRLGESQPHRADSVAALSLRTGKEEWSYTAAVKAITDEQQLPRWRSQIGHGIYGRQRVVFDGQRFYALGNGKVDAFELDGSKAVKHLWSAPCPRVYCEALAANALLIGSQDRLLVLDPKNGKTLTDVALKGQVRGLAIAEGRVLATTEGGTVYALQGGLPQQPSKIPQQGFPTTKEQPVSIIAKQLVQQHQLASAKGYAVVASTTDARLAQELAAMTSLHVICLLPQRDRVAQEQQRLLRETTLYGTRLVVQATDTAKKELPLISHFANVVVVAGKEQGVSPAELYRLLRPCGGQMAFVDTDAQAFVGAAGVPKAEIFDDNGRVFLVRGKLPGAFDWDSKAEADERVRWPLEFQWFGEPNGQLLVSRHSRPRTPIPAHGRLFIFGESHLTAVDAYNGTPLWRRRLSVAACTGQQRVSADNDFVYVQDAGLTWQFDAATGKLVRAYGAGGGPSVFVADQPQRWTASNKKGETGTVGVTLTPTALEITLRTESTAPTRDDRWELAFDFRPVAERLTPEGRGAFELVVDPWRGVLIPHPTAAHPAPVVRLVEKPKEHERTIVLSFTLAELEKWLGYKPADFAFAADVKLWTEDFRPLLWGRPLLTGSGKRTWLNEAEAVVVLADKPKRTVAGQLSAYAPIPLAAAVELPAVATKSGRLPPMTLSRPDGDFSADFKEGLGKEGGKGKDTLKRLLEFELKQRQHPLTGEDVTRDYSRSYGCSGTSCSAAMDFFRSGTIGMYDRLEDAGMRNISGIRSGCGQTLVPAFGMLLYSESASDCLCSYSFATSLAMAPAKQKRNEDWALFDDQHLSAGLIRQTALNLGAPGDRRDADNTLWLAYPRPPLGLAKQTAFNLPFSYEVANGFGLYRINTDRQPIANTERPWLYGSGLKGLTRLQLDLVHHQPAKLLLSVAPNKAPKIDGQLDDECWDGFSPLPLASGNGNVYLRHDATHLYIAHEQKLPRDRVGKTNPWKATVTQNDGPFERDDHLRLSFCNANGTKVLTFAVTAAGGRYDAQLDLGPEGTLKSKRMPIPTEDVDWNGTWSAKSYRDAEVFRTEMAIPWNTLTDAGLTRQGLLVECTRKSRWGGAKDASLTKLLENAVEIQSLNRATAPRSFTVRLHFAELEAVAPGERVFDVVIQGKTVLKDFDIMAATGGRYKAIVREFPDVLAEKHLTIQLRPKTKTLSSSTAPVLSAVEVQLQNKKP